MKRFYKIVSTQRDMDGVAILLDGKPVKTPMENTLRAPNEALANEVVQEWAGQEEDINPLTMPLTQMLSTCLDRIAASRAEISADVLNYLNTDLLCYRTAHPPELVSAQEEHWNPWLDWFEKKFGAVLATTTDLQALSQPEEAHSAAKDFVEGLDDDRFTVLQLITSISGSLVLAMAFVDGETDADTVFDAARVEEKFKAELYNEDFYGTDPAQEKKDDAVKIDLSAAQKYLALVS